MRLENRTKNHYKFYELNIIPSGKDDIWAVITKWGSISTNKPRTDTMKIGTFQECQKEFDRLLNKRYRNGYSKIL